MHGDLVVHNIGRLLTFPGDGPVGCPEVESPVTVEGAAVLIRGGRFSFVGAEKDLWDIAEIPPDCRCIDAGGRCAVPGFVDPHTHAVFAGSREFELPMKLKGASYLDILRAGGGILRTMEETRKASVDELVRGMDERLDRMMLYGTTCAEVKTGYGLDERSEMRLLRAIGASEHPVHRIATFLGPHAVPPEYMGRPDDYIDLMISMLPGIAGEGLATYADIFCERDVFDAEMSMRFLAAAKEAGLGTKIHSDEIENLGGTMVGAELGAVSAEHLLVSERHDLEAMRRSGTIPVLLPGTLMTIFEERVPPVTMMRELGLPIALATDLNPNCMLESMQLVQALACYRLRMTPNEVLAASTVNAAYAVGMGGKKGSVTPGHDGDLLILKDDSFDHVPYHFGSNHVDRVIIGGNVMIDAAGW
ncbi:MAG: imidazolonepropionase [Candidatus Thermoplasmatota archaeon]|nr:imidazolonepropionase [Candidatus Thermoplasmatota archaeon]